MLSRMEVLSRREHLYPLPPQRCRRNRVFLGMELLEDRRTPAVITVNGISDHLEMHKPEDLRLSLREAIHLANGTLKKEDLDPFEQILVEGDPTAASKDTIKFGNIGDGVVRYGLVAALPKIDKGPVIIDGTPPAAHKTQVFAIDGDNEALGEVDGLVFAKSDTGDSSGSSVFGIIVRNCKGNGIWIDNVREVTVGGTASTEQRNTISGNYVGIKVSGDTALRNVIAGNVIVGNTKKEGQARTGYGILIEGGADLNKVGIKAE